MNIINVTLGAGTVAAASMWTTILTGLAVALGGGLVLFGLNWLKDVLMARWKRHSNAEALAFALMTDLDQLISGCTDVIHDPLHIDEHGISETTVADPVISFSDKIDWTVFPKKLQFQIRSLPNKIDAAQRSCGHLWEYGSGPPDYWDMIEERQYRFAFIGLEACTINEQLAKDYEVPTLDRGEWKPEENFKSMIAKISAARAKRDAEDHLWNPFYETAPIEELKKRSATLTADLEVALSQRKIIRSSEAFEPQ